jgi:hypothetical protein
MIRRHVSHAFAVAAALVTVAGTTEAQTAESRRHALSINPLGIPFEYLAVEYEGRVNPAFTLGANVTYFGPDDNSYTSFEIKGRLYPNERALRGFSIGLTAGYANLEEDDCGDTPYPDCSSSDNGPTVGVIIDYNWLLGKTDRFYIGLGTGAKRVLGVDSDDFDDLPVAYPTIRFQVGYAF